MGKAYANKKPKELQHFNQFYETPYSLTWELQKLNGNLLEKLMIWKWQEI